MQHAHQCPYLNKKLQLLRLFNNLSGYQFSTGKSSRAERQALTQSRAGGPFMVGPLAGSTFANTKPPASANGPYEYNSSAGPYILEPMAGFRDCGSTSVSEPRASRCSCSPPQSRPKKEKKRKKLVNGAKSDCGGSNLKQREPSLSTSLISSVCM
jgi:hypothetical protein